MTLSDSSTMVLLIRHCHATGQEPEAPLSPEGERAAAALAATLQALRVDALFSSPFARARATLEPFSRQARLPVTTDPRLAERILESLPSEGWREHIRQSFGDLDYRAPGGETLREAQARGVAAAGEFARRGNRLAAIATHGNLLAGILRSADPSFGYEAWNGLRNPDLFQTIWRDGKLLSFERLAFGVPA